MDQDQTPDPQDQPQPEQPDKDRTVPAEQDYQDAARSTADFVQNVKPIQENKRKAKRGKWFLIVFVVLVMFGVAGFAFYQYQQNSVQKEKEKQAQQDQKKKQQTQVKTSGPQSYSSQELNLSLDYPGSWELDSSDSAKLILQSPKVKLPDENGQQTDAVVVLTIVPGVANSDLPADQATAVRASEKFAYASPAEGQRQETYLSFLNTDGASSGLNAVYISGDSNYTKGDPVRKADFDTVQPIIWLEFHKCSGSSCSGLEKLTVPAELWGANQTLNDAFSIMKSLNIK